MLRQRTATSTLVGRRTDVYAKKYTNKKGQEKIEVLLSLEEAKRVVEVSPVDLVARIKEAIAEPSEHQQFTPRGTPGNLEGLKILFDEVDPQGRRSSEDS